MWPIQAVGTTGELGCSGANAVCVAGTSTEYQMTQLRKIIDGIAARNQNTGDPACYWCDGGECTSDLGSGNEFRCDDVNLILSSQGVVTGEDRYAQDFAASTTLNSNCWPDNGPALIDRTIEGLVATDAYRSATPASCSTTTSTSCHTPGVQANCPGGETCTLQTSLCFVNGRAEFYRRAEGVDPLAFTADGAHASSNPSVNVMGTPTPVSGHDLMSDLWASVLAPQSGDTEPWSSSCSVPWIIAE